MLCNNYRVILLGKKNFFYPRNRISVRVSFADVKCGTDWDSKQWKIRDVSPVFFILVTLRHIYMNRFLSLEVTESLFLQLIPESNHCIFN